MTVPPALPVSGVRGEEKSIEHLSIGILAENLRENHAHNVMMRARNLVWKIVSNVNTGSTPSTSAWLTDRVS
jgi:hypothetical protein